MGAARTDDPHEPTTSDRPPHGLAVRSNAAGGGLLAEEAERDAAQPRSFGRSGVAVDLTPPARSSPRRVTRYVMTGLQNGESFSEVVLEAKRLGYTEVVGREGTRVARI